MPQLLPSGRWRGRVRHPRTGKQIAPHVVIGGPATYPDEPACRRAEDDAREALTDAAILGVTVRGFWNEWTADPLWRRPAQSTNLHNRERTERFVQRYGDRQIRSIGDDVV